MSDDQLPTPVPSSDQELSKEERDLLQSYDDWRRGRLVGTDIEILFGGSMPYPKESASANAKRSIFSPDLGIHGIPSTISDQRYARNRRWRHAIKAKPRVTMAKIIVSRQKAAREMVPQRVAGGGLASSELQFGTGGYFDPLITAMWFEPPAGAMIIAKMVNALMAELKPSLNAKREVLLDYINELIDVEPAIVKDQIDPKIVEGWSRLSSVGLRGSAAKDLIHDAIGHLKRNFHSATDGDLGAVDRRHERPRPPTDDYDFRQVANMALEFSLMMAATQLCRQMLAEVDLDRDVSEILRPALKPPKKESIETRRKKSEAAKRVLEAYNAELEQARREGRSDLEINAIKRPSLVGRRWKRISERPPGPVKRGRPFGTTKAAMAERRAELQRKAEEINARNLDKKRELEKAKAFFDSEEGRRVYGPR